MLLLSFECSVVFLVSGVQWNLNDNFHTMYIIVQEIPERSWEESLNRKLRRVCDIFSFKVTVSYLYNWYLHYQLKTYVVFFFLNFSLVWLLLCSSEWRWWIETKPIGYMLHLKNVLRKLLDQWHDVGSFVTRKWINNGIGCGSLKNNESMASFTPVNSPQLWLITHRNDQ